MQGASPLPGVKLCSQSARGQRPFNHLRSRAQYYSSRLGPQAQGILLFCPQFTVHFIPSHLKRASPHPLALSSTERSEGCVGSEALHNLKQAQPVHPPPRPHFSWWVRLCNLPCPSCCTTNFIYRFLSLVTAISPLVVCEYHGLFLFIFYQSNSLFVESKKTEPKKLLAKFGSPVKSA